MWRQVPAAPPALRREATAVAERTLYLFDGYNLLHAGAIAEPQELVDRLAGYVALRGARGVVVFDGAGEERSYGQLGVRFAEHADQLIERLAAEHRAAYRVVVVSSDREIIGVAGREAEHRSAQSFLRELTTDRPSTSTPARSQIENALDPETRERLERWRRRR